MTDTVLLEGLSKSTNGSDSGSKLFGIDGGCLFELIKVDLQCPDEQSVAVEF